MGKIHRDVSIDIDIYKDFVNVVGKGNVSAKLQEYMENFNRVSKNNIEEINTKLVKIKIDELQETISKAQAELHVNMELLEKSKKLASDIEIKRLEDEKNKIESEKKCTNCNQVIIDKKDIVIVATGIICKSCLYSSYKEKHSEWFPPKPEEIELSKKIKQAINIEKTTGDDNE